MAYTDSIFPKTTIPSAGRQQVCSPLSCLYLRNLCHLWTSSSIPRNKEMYHDLHPQIAQMAQMNSRVHLRPASVPGVISFAASPPGHYGTRLILGAPGPTPALITCSRRLTEERLPVCGQPCHTPFRHLDLYLSWKSLSLIISPFLHHLLANSVSLILQFAKGNTAQQKPRSFCNQLAGTWSIERECSSSKSVQVEIQPRGMSLSWRDSLAIQK